MLVKSLKLFRLQSHYNLNQKHSSLSLTKVIKRYMSELRKENPKDLVPPKS